MKTRLYKNPPPYFIVLASSVKTKEVEVIEFRRFRSTKKYMFFNMAVTERDLDPKNVPV